MKRYMDERDIGSSPRGRGTLDHVESEVVKFRFIPAWAGNTVITANCPAIYTVHPRVGGEHEPR